MTIRPFRIPCQTVGRETAKQEKAFQSAHYTQPPAHLGDATHSEVMS